MLKLITSFKFSTRKHMSGKKIIYALQNGNKRLAKISSKIHKKKNTRYIFHQTEDMCGQYLCGLENS